MNRLLFAASSLFLLSAWFASRSLLVTADADTKAGGGGAATLEAAGEFLAALDAAQRAKAVFSFDDKERFDWHFIPRPRKGLPLNEVSAAQKERLKALLRASLSEAGFKTAEAVRDLEAILREIEGPERRFPRDPELYFATVFGAPAKDAKWGWRFEGHHLSLNFTLDGDRMVSATPLVFGANPALVRDGPKKGLRVLAGVEDVARELMKSLDEAQLALAVGKGMPEEVKGEQTPRYRDALPKGLEASRLNDAQKALLRKLLGEYIQHLKDDVQSDVEKEIQATGGIEKTEIAWRGSLKPFEGHSYIVHGPAFILSYANFQNNAAHVHSAFRTRKLEFGLAD
jgi:hypothetical protein